MAQLTCEMCGGVNLVKQDGAFVCQNCGTKYSVEEARKMMGVSSDIAPAAEQQVRQTPSFVEKALQNARRAKQKEDWEETEKYYNMVEQNDPTNIEAIFYSSYGKAKVSLTSDDIYRRQAIFKALTNSVSILDDNYDIAKEPELRDTLKDITLDVINMFTSQFVFTQTKNGYGNVTGDNKNMTYQLFINLAVELHRSLTNIIEKFPADRHKDILYIYKLRLSVAEILGTSTCVSNASRKTWLNTCTTQAQGIKQMDPGFAVKDYDSIIAQIEKSEKNSAVGCLIGGIIVVALAIFIGVLIGLS